MMESHRARPTRASRALGPVYRMQRGAWKPEDGDRRTTGEAGWVQANGGCGEAAQSSAERLASAPSGQTASSEGWRTALASGRCGSNSGFAGDGWSIRRPRAHARRSARSVVRDDVEEHSIGGVVWGSYLWV